MKSRITIDVDYDNQPIIKIEWVESEDVRDKLVKRFLEAFGGKSIFANFYYNHTQGNSNLTAKIRPIGSDQCEGLNKVWYPEPTTGAVDSQTVSIKSE